MRALALFLGLIVLLATPALASAGPTSTVANLQIAFEAEMNAAQRLSAFARQAEHEGFAHVGRLFRAVAFAENVHAEKHADVIRSLGGQPRATIAGIEVGSTRDNLRAAIARDAFDREGMYPSLLASAREIGDTSPLATLGVAMFMEKIHLKLFEEALRTLGEDRDASVEFCVSRRSGYVTTCAPQRQLAGCVTPAAGTVDLAP